MNQKMELLRPSAPFVGASWATLIIGTASYFIGLWNSPMSMSDKGFYFAALILGLFAAISLQKTVRDKLEGIKVTNTYVGVCWASLFIAIIMLAAGLFNAPFDLSVKGFYGMAYLLSMFAVVTVQKNIRDGGLFEKHTEVDITKDSDSAQLGKR